MNQYHPIVEILSKNFGVTEKSIVPIHEQLLAYREDTNGLKEILIKHNVTNEIIFQKALAKYFELEYRENFDEIQSLKEFTEIIPIRYAKKYNFFPIEKSTNKIKVSVTNPEFSQPLDDLARHFKCHIETVVSNKQAVIDLINRAYDQSSSST